MNFSEIEHLLVGHQARRASILRLLKLTLHRPRIRLDLQLRGLAEKTLQSARIQTERGDSGLTVGK